MDRDSWLETRPYLRPVARFCGQVEAAAAQPPADTVPVPSWDDYRSDFLAGVPLLQSPVVALDLETAGRMTIALVERLASGALDGGHRIVRREQLEQFASATRRSFTAEE